MELARLASKQAASKQQASSAGPFLVHRAEWVPKSKKKLPRYPGWFSATVSGTFFFWSDPHRLETVIYWGFGPFWAAGTERNSGAGPKTEKRNFPVLGVPKRGKKVTTLSGMVIRNFLTVYVLADWTPRAGKHEIRGFSAILA